MEAIEKQLKTISVMASCYNWSSEEEALNAVPICQSLVNRILRTNIEVDSLDSVLDCSHDFRNVLIILGTALPSSLSSVTVYLR